MADLTRSAGAEGGAGARRKRAWLPLGSVVVLEGGNVPLLVVGREQRAVADGRTWDYSAVPYPEGYHDADHLLLFDEGQVDLLLFMGFQTPRDEALRRHLDDPSLEGVPGRGWPPEGYENPLAGILEDPGPLAGQGAPALHDVAADAGFDDGWAALGDDAKNYAAGS